MQLVEVKWPDVEALSRDTPIVIPIAALEQHGRHMPVFTDSLLLGEVIRRVSERLQDRVLFTPLFWLGNSEHHIDFPGTMTAAPRVYLDVLKDMVENFLVHGFRRIVLVNGHGGNIVPGAQAMFEIRQKYRQRRDLVLISTTYWTLGAQPQKASDTLVQSRMGHACEWETSMMLRIRPELVGDYKAVAAIAQADPFEPAHRGWITKDRSQPGHIGDPAQASAEKGELLFRLFADDVTNFLERVIAYRGDGDLT
jgi:creatinine amidohydrolase